MAFVRKYFAWIIIGLVLLAEFGIMFFTLQKQAQAKAARTRLEERRGTRDQLKRQTIGIADRIKVHDKRRAIAGGELTDSVLLVWHQGQAIEGLFDAKPLAAYNAHPWEAPPKFDVFRQEYQDVYSREVEKLLPVMEKLGVDAGSLGLADPAGFSQATVTIGDIFAMQKDFWVKKGILDILAKSALDLESLTVGGTKSPARGPAALAMGPPPGQLSEPIPVRIAVSCSYPRLGDFLDDLMESPLCFRLTKVESIERIKPREQGRAVAPAAKGGAAAEGAAGPLEPLQLVSIRLEGEVPDIAVEVESALFEKAQFADKAKVAGWLDGQAKELDASRKRYGVPTSRGGTDAPRPELGVAWIKRELDRARKAQAPPILITDELGGPKRKREYSFARLEDAEEWLERRYDYEVARIDALRNLYGQLRARLAVGASDPKTRVGVFAEPPGVLVGMRPASQFDQNRMFQVSPAPGVVVRLGVITFVPAESRDGVRRATSTTRR